MPEIDLDAVPRPALTAAVRAALALADELERKPHIVDPLQPRVAVARRLRATVTAALAAGGAE